MISLLQTLLLMAAAAISFVAPTYSQDSVRFAVIGDFGWAGKPESDVATLVKSWNPGLVITLGDNNYPRGAESTIDANIGAYYSEFIGDYKGAHGSGSPTNRFWPSLGNHDLMTDKGGPYFDYFTLPGNERYYDFESGPVHFFVLNSNRSEPDGVTADSRQALWLKERLASSTSPWNVVYFHHPPYSSGDHGPTSYMQWPFRTWGADLILSGHDHTYERLEVEGLTYIVNGLGGAVRYKFKNPQKSSTRQFNSDHMALLIVATATTLKLEAFRRNGDLIDRVELQNQ